MISKARKTPKQKGHTLIVVIKIYILSYSLAEDGLSI
jgi:hypothetical protein